MLSEIYYDYIDEGNNFKYDAYKFHTYYKIIVPSKLSVNSYQKRKKKKRKRRDLSTESRSDSLPYSLENLVREAIERYEEMSECQPSLLTGRDEDDSSKYKVASL